MNLIFLGISCFLSLYAFFYINALIDVTDEGKKLALLLSLRIILLLICVCLSLSFLSKLLNILLEKIVLIIIFLLILSSSSRQ